MLWEMPTRAYIGRARMHTTTPHPRAAYERAPLPRNRHTLASHTREPPWCKQARANGKWRVVAIGCGTTGNHLTYHKHTAPPEGMTARHRTGADRVRARPCFATTLTNPVHTHCANATNPHPVQGKP